jgi:hypothetical protein
MKLEVAVLIFNKNNSHELNEYLFNSCVHDSKIEKTDIAPDGKSATVIIFNTWSMERVRFCFNNLSTLLFVDGSDLGARDTINYLALEKDFTHLRPHLKDVEKFSQRSLYLLFQTFCGSELHFVSEVVTIEVLQAD